MITKPVVLVNKDVVQDTLLNNVIPVIKKKWPKFNGVDEKKILLQQDNAKPNCKLDDPVLADALTQMDGKWNWVVSNQILLI